jgi:hypothetical protein
MAGREGWVNVDLVNKQDNTAEHATAAVHRVRHLLSAEDTQRRAASVSS